MFDRLQMAEIDQAKLWYQTSLDVFLNRWFSKYEDARKSLDEHGGFLLPYRHHFYVCKAEVIKALGLDPDDPDWKAIGYDCARPANDEAFARLQAKRQRIVDRASEQSS
jgi:hypothetical protein